MSDTQPVAGQAPAAPQYTAAQLIEIYLKLRAKKKAQEKENAAKLAPINEAMAQIDGMLLAICKQQGTDALKAKGIGTATPTVTIGYSIKEPEKFRAFVIAQQAWDMVDWKANKDACEQHAQENNGALPPGTARSAYEHMSVRKAPAKAE